MPIPGVNKIFLGDQLLCDPSGGGPVIPRLRGAFDGRGEIIPPSSGVTNTWIQVHSGFAYDIMIYDVQAGSVGASYIELGSGASGSEVAQAIFHSNIRNNTDMPYGMFVPASTRIVMRQSASSWSLSRLLYVKTDTPGERAAAGAISGLAGGGTWTELATSPPLVDGVWITDLRSNGPGDFGFGPSGEEEAFALGNFYYDHPPIWWPPATRLVARQASGTAWVRWREHLR